MRFFAVLCLVLFLPAAATAGSFEDAKAAFDCSDWNTTLKQLRPLADGRNPFAQKLIGEMYDNCGFNGYWDCGLKQDKAEAVKWYQKAINQWLPLAERGDAKAQYEIGMMYHEGLGVKYDESEAVKWVRKAAEQGGVEAQYTLGDMYFMDSPRKLEEAFRWYRKAADQGNAGAQTQIGGMYLHGDGVKQDFALVVKQFRIEANKGDRVAQDAIGYMYESGKGVKQSYIQALKWYIIAGTTHNELKEKMTSEKIAEAERLATEWKPSHHSTSNLANACKKFPPRKMPSGVIRG